MKETRAIAIIPARGGSKGIPGKNLAQLSGKPLIGWTIEAARQSRQVSRVMVSTDDPAIAQTAEDFAAEVVMRPSEISGDEATSEEALLHVLNELGAEADAELIVFLQCTSPLTAADDIDGTIDVLRRENADTAVAVVPFKYFLWRRETGGSAVGVNHDHSIRLLRQQREPDYLETGAVYVMRTEAFRQEKRRFFGKTALYIMPPERRWEIDDPLDLEVASVLLEQSARQQRAAQLPDRLDAVVLDFDGVFTDNRVFVSSDGSEAVVCNRSDGMGLSRLQQSSIPILVVSSETSEVVAQRCRKLGLEYLQSVDDKLSVLLNWLEERSLALERTIFVGNDVNDLACMRAVGCPVAVGDAYPIVKESARIVLNCNGGQGALRELSDLLLHHVSTSGHPD